MKPCPRCNHEIQQDQAACPECGVVFAQWDAAHSSSPAPASPLAPAKGANLFLSSPASTTEQATGMSNFELKWNVLLYATFLAFAVFLAPRTLWSQIFLNENDTWSALTQDGMGTIFGMLVALFVGAMLLRDIIKISESPGWRKASAWLVIRAVLAGMVIAIFWFGSKANRDIEQKADSLIEEALSRIKPGMERAMVHGLILKANAALVPRLDTLISTTAWEASKYDEVRYALKNAQAGNPVAFKEQEFNRIFFNSNERAPSKKDPEHREVFVRSCCAFVFAWTRYDLFIEYDQQDHLKFVRYLKSRHGDGADTSCHVRLEIPASKGKQYPYPCPPDVQGF